MSIQQIKRQASHYVSSVFIAVFLGLAGSAGLWAAESPEVSVAPWPDKVLYDAGATAVFDVTIKNSTDKTVSGKLNVQVIWEIEESKALLNQAIEIKAGQTNEVCVKWENMPEVLGCEVRADFSNDKGEAVASGSEYFNVCRHLDTARVGIHGGGMDLQTYSNETYMKNIPGKIAFKRAHYLNIGEWFPAKCSVWNLAPKEDEWSGGYWESKKALQLGIQEAHKHGMKAVVYATAYALGGLDPVEVALRHPDWILYDKTGRPAPEIITVDVKTEDLLRSIEAGAVKDKYTPPCFCSIFGNWMVPEHLDFHIDQLIANAKMFGMDGVRYDGHPGEPTIFNREFFNVEGRPATMAAEESDRILKHIKQRIRKELPNYLFMYNAGCAFRYVDSSGNIKTARQEVPRDNGAWCDEEFRGAYSSYNEFHEWKKYADLLVNDVDVMRKAGGHAYGLFPLICSIHKNSIELGYSIMLAAGDHPWFADPEQDDTSCPGGSPYPIQKELYAFATRFSAMLWGKDIERVKKAEDVVNVSSEKGDIWWKNFVHRRMTVKGQKLIIVHLLNAPPNQSMGVTDQPLPAPIDNVTIQFKTPVKKVWFATARPGPVRVVNKSPDELWKIAVLGFGTTRIAKQEWYGPMRCDLASPADGKVVLPQLRVWTMVVAEVKE